MSNTKTQTSDKHFSAKQGLFLRYLTWTLVDLTVLNFFAEYWDKVTITSFGVSLFIAFVLQVLLKMTISLEHKISGYIKSSERLDRKLIHIFSTWFVLFASKFVMLWVLGLFFGSTLVFAGAYHGVITFIVVVSVMLLAEYLILRIFEALK